MDAFLSFFFVSWPTRNLIEQIEETSCWKTIGVCLMITAPAVWCLWEQRRHPPLWEARMMRGVRSQRGTSRGSISVSVEWGSGGWWGRRGAGGLEQCRTGLCLSLTNAVLPMVSGHPCYGRLASKQDTWGAKINSWSNSTFSWHHL